jgi:hypothetical protein
MTGLSIEEAPLPAARSFNSAAQSRRATGDYGADATELWNQRADEPKQSRMMDKIAMLETAVLAMNRKIEHLQAERKTEDHEIELLQLKLNEVQRHNSVELIEAEDVDMDDDMNLQLDAEMAHLASSIDRLSSEPVLHQSTKDEALTSLAALKTKLAARKQAIGSDDTDVELESSNFSIMDEKPADEGSELPCDGEEAAKKAEDKATEKMARDDAKADRKKKAEEDAEKAKSDNAAAEFKKIEEKEASEVER